MRWSLVFLGAISCMSFSWQANASTIRSDVSDSSYTALGSNYSSSVGYIYEYTNSGTYIGSGTIISTSSTDAWVLTAAHVVDDATSLKFSINGTTYAADSWSYYSSVGDSNVASSSVGDVGLIHISSAISNATAATLYSGTTSSLLGTAATFVGYGNTGTGSTGSTSGTYGTLRAVQNVLDTTASSQWGTSYSSSVLLSDFDSPSATTGNNGGKGSKTTAGRMGGFGKNPFSNFGNNPFTRPGGKGNGNSNSNPGGNASDNSNNTISSGSATPLDLEGLIAGGDSGGGVFASIGGVEYLVGINSFVSYTDGTSNSDYGDISGCVSVCDYLTWINSQISSTSSLAFTGAMDMVSVPEPSSFCLLAIAGLALCVWRRSRAE